MNVRALVQLGQRALPSTRRGVLVLAYHLVGGGTKSPVDLPVAAFAQQLDHLLDHCQVVGLKQALAEMQRPSERPRVVLTFDDAYQNFASVVFPMLRERRLPAVLYVPAGFVAGNAGPPLTGAALPACSWSDLRELERAGVEMGSHGVEHVDMRRLNDTELEREMSQSRDVLRSELGVDPTSFCYVQGKHDARVVAAARRHYTNAVAGGGRRFRGGDLHLIPRTPIRRDDTDFARLLTARVWITEALANYARQLRQ